MPDVVSCMPAALVAQAAWPGLEKPGPGHQSPGPHKFYLLGGTEGPPIFLKLALLPDIVLFLGSLLFMHRYTLWALLALGSLFRKDPQLSRPGPPTSELISPGLGLAKFTHLPSSRRYIHSACKRSSYWRVASTPPPPLCVYVQMIHKGFFNRITG